VTHLRTMMLEELQRRNYAANTIHAYLRSVEHFSRHFKRSPDQLTRDHLREYQAYLLNDRKLQPRTVKLRVSALRFFFVKTLKRRYLLEDMPYPNVPRRLPTILTVEEVTRLIDAARTLTDRTMLMVLYSTGMRNAEMRQLQVRDIDSRSMLIHIQRGKGGRDRCVPLSPTLLATLRAYWRWMKPKTWLFPGTIAGWRADNRSRRRWSGMPASPPRRARTFTNVFQRICCAIRTPRICWQLAPTCARSNCCSAM